MASSDIPYLVLAIALGFAIVGAAWVHLVLERKKLQALAQRLGLEYVKERPRFTLAVIFQAANLQKAERDIFVEGKIGNRTVQFGEFKVWESAIGQSNIKQWAEVAVAAATGDNEFSLKCKHPGWKVLEWMQEGDVTVGDPAFDARWQIRTNHPEIVPAILSPSLRAKLDAASQTDTGGQYRLFDGWMCYLEQGSVSAARTITRLEAKVGLLIDLAAAAELACVR
jgi:hypothetical protein